MTAARASAGGRLNLPLSAADRSLIDAAALQLGQTAGRFVRDAALRAAHQATVDRELSDGRRSVCLVEDLDPATIAAIGQSVVPDDQADLDDLIKDWRP